MAQEGLRVRARAHVRVLKYDENGALMGVEEHDVDLTEEEAIALWLSQQQE